MTPEQIIQHYFMHEIDESNPGPALPEAIPTSMLRTFADPWEAKAYTNHGQTAWLLTSKAERRFLLEAPLES
jgi:hypothetical protein